MKTVVLIAIILGFCSCAESQKNEDNSPPFPSDNSIGIRFIDEMGNDASGRVDMTLERTYNGVEYYKISPENYSYHCFLNGEEIPQKYYLGDLKEHQEESIINLHITKGQSEKVKTFWFRLITFYGIWNDWHSDELYQFDYRFRIPSLLGDQENSLTIMVKAKDLVYKIYEEVTFNGQDIPHNQKNLFTICINNKSIK